MPKYTTQLKYNISHAKFQTNSLTELAMPLKNYSQEINLLILFCFTGQVLRTTKLICQDVR